MQSDCGNEDNKAVGIPSIVLFPCFVYLRLGPISLDSTAFDLRTHFSHKISRLGNVGASRPSSFRLIFIVRPILHAPTTDHRHCRCPATAAADPAASKQTRCGGGGGANPGGGEGGASESPTSDTIRPARTHEWFRGHANQKSAAVASEKYGPES